MLVVVRTSSNQWLTWLTVSSYRVQKLIRSSIYIEYMVILILLHGLSWLLYCTYFSSTYVWVTYPYLPSDHLLSPEVLFRILKLLYKRVIPQNNITPTYFLVSLSLSLWSSFVSFVIKRNGGYYFDWVIGCQFVIWLHNFRIIIFYFVRLA